MAGYKVNKSIADINKKIRQGKAVVLNAEDMIELVKKQGKVKAAAEVDVVTTGTFSTMCSSGLLFNQGQEPPVMKTSKVWLNNVPAYGGIAAVDAFLGATEPIMPVIFYRHKYIIMRNACIPSNILIQNWNWDTHTNSK